MANPVAKSLPPTPPEGNATINQCDGCRRGMPISEGIHYGVGYDLIACTKDRYDSVPPTPESVSLTRAYDLREAADDLERMSRRYESPGVKQIFAERVARLRAWADEIGPDGRSFTTTMESPDAVR